MARRKLKTIHEYTCKLCGDVFQDGDLAVAHLVRRHPEKAKGIELDACPECGNQKLKIGDDVFTQKKFKYCDICWTPLGTLEGGVSR